MATGRVTDACFDRHTHIEFLVFLKQVAKAYPWVQLHVVADNYATHKHPKVKAWLERLATPLLKRLAVPIPQLGVRVLSLHSLRVAEPATTVTEIVSASIAPTSMTGEPADRSKRFRARGPPRRG